jgi:hypothetical protein
MTQALQRREDISLLPTTDTLKSMFDMSDALYKSGLLPNHIKSPQAAFAVIQKGLELGIPPMYSMSNIIVIQGKPTANAELMLALIYRDHGDNAIQFSESSSTKCTVLYRRKAWASPLSHSFTIEEAKTAGLLSNQTWQKYPKAMLRARCISAVARLAFPDSIGGMYTPEELGAQVSVSDDDEVLIVEDTQPTAKLLTMPSQPSQETTTRDSQRAAEDCERVGKEAPPQSLHDEIRGLIQQLAAFGHSTFAQGKDRQERIIKHIQATAKDLKWDCEPQAITSANDLTPGELADYKQVLIKELETYKKTLDDDAII